MSEMRSRRIASAAEKRVGDRAIADKHGKLVMPTKYASRVRNLAVWIRESGLAQTLSFLRDKASDPENRADGHVLVDLAAVLGSETGDELFERLKNESDIGYRLLTRDAMVACLWMKRACDYDRGSASNKAEGGEGRNP